MTIDVLVLHGNVVVIKLNRQTYQDILGVLVKLQSTSWTKTNNISELCSLVNFQLICETTNNGNYGLNIDFLKENGTNATRPDQLPSH